LFVSPGEQKENVLRPGDKEVLEGLSMTGDYQDVIFQILATNYLSGNRLSRDRRRTGEMNRIGDGCRSGFESRLLHNAMEQKKNKKMETNNEKFDLWCIVELFGHNRIAGRCTDNSVGNIGDGKERDIKTSGVKRNRRRLSRRRRGRFLKSCTEMNQGTCITAA
jgi:hypothetical protein